MQEETKHFVYQTSVVEFITITAQTCLFLEHAQEETMQSFADTMRKLLPLLYLKAQLVATPDRELGGYSQQFVTEEDYESLRTAVATLMEDRDIFLELGSDESTFGAEPMQCSIAELTADIYQELKDLAGNYQSGDESTMNDSIADCLDAFHEHWGLKLLTLLKALHSIE